MAPLRELKKSGTKWIWTASHEATRLNIIDYRTCAPLHTIFKEGVPTELHTDASDADPTITHMNWRLWLL